MAQPNSAQREPSMEEILASIRRIIEDSDTSRRNVEAAEQPADNAPPEATDVHAFRFGLREQPDYEASSEPAQQQAGTEIDRADRHPVEDEPAGGEGTAAPFEGLLRPSVEADADEIEMELNLDDFSEGDAPDTTDASQAQEEGTETRPAIMSEHVGRQVAASFGELSAAFEARSRKSFDEIAEEMMRPMLQDWLDNNLPLLVERLVREEIERIARGAASPR